MTLNPWKGKQREQSASPLPPLSELRNEVDRLFDAYLREPFGALSERFNRREWQPALDIAENDKEVTIRAELPGVDPKDIEITVTGNRLTLSGEKKEVREEKDKDYYQSETRYGSFQRVVELPSGVEADNVTAEHANGVLTVRLAKSQAAESKRIPVSTSKPTTK